MPTWFLTFCKVTDLLVYWALLVPFALAYRRRAQLTGGLVTLRIVPLFLLVIYCLMQAAIALWHYNLPLVHLNTVGEALLYMKVYHDEFVDEKMKRSIRVLAVVFVVFAALDSFWLEGFGKINSYTNLAESVIIISLGLLYFERTLIGRRRTQLQKVPMFVATIGIILYLSGTVVLYLATNHFIQINDEYSARLMYLINSALVLMLGLLFSRAFLLVKQQTLLRTAAVR